MKKYIGGVSAQGAWLEYYVQGNQKVGYSIRIREIRQEQATAMFSKSCGEAMRVAKKLKRGRVFPYNLEEFVEEF